MKSKTRKTIAKRLTVKKSGLIERTVPKNQHLRRRKSRRSLHASQAGSAAISPSDKKELGL